MPDLVGQRVQPALGVVDVLESPVDRRLQARPHRGERRGQDQRGQHDGGVGLLAGDAWNSFWNKLIEAEYRPARIAVSAP